MSVMETKRVVAEARMIVASLGDGNKMKIALLGMNKDGTTGSRINSVFKKFSLDYAAYSRFSCIAHFISWCGGDEYTIIKLENVWQKKSGLGKTIIKKNQYFVVKKDDITTLHGAVQGQVQVQVNKSGSVTSLEVVKTPEEEAQEAQRAKKQDQKARQMFESTLGPLFDQKLQTRLPATENLQRTKHQYGSNEPPI